jgi:hypothetical protein
VAQSASTEQGAGLQEVKSEAHAIKPGHAPVDCWQACVLSQVPLVSIEVVELHEDVPQEAPSSG